MEQIRFHTEATVAWTEDIALTQWHQLCEFYNFQCLKCNKQFPFEELTLDHVKPVSKGGSSNISNTQPLCKKCNSSKGSKEIDYRKAIPGPVWQQDTLF